MPTLRRTLLVPMLLLVAIMGVALLGVGLETTVEARALRTRVTATQRTTALVLRLTQLQGETVQAVLAYPHDRDARLLDGMREADAEAEQIMAELDRAELPPRGARLWAACAESLRSRAVERARLAEALAGGDPVATRVARSRWNLARVHAAALLADFTGYDVKLLDRAVSSLEASRARTIVVFAAALALSAAIAAVFAWFVHRQVVRPLLALTEATERIPEGRLGVGTQEARGDEIGTLARAFARMTDTLLATNARLSAAVRARDEFISIASHELRTPLSSLKLQLQLVPRRLAEAGLAPGPQPRWLDVAQRQVGKLERLVNDLLDVTRIASGRLELRPEPVDLSALVHDVAERFAPELARAGNALEASIMPRVRGRWDPDRLDQVLANLLANALRHAPGTPVSVGLRVEDDTAVLVVRARGPGVSPELRGRLFERFGRGPGSRDHGGLGLGLYIARQVVEAHGGGIRVTGGPGEGAVFEVRLPGAAIDADAASVAGVAGASPAE